MEVEKETISAEERRFEQDFNAWLDHMEREIRATRESEILTAEDYAIRINTVAE